MKREDDFGRPARGFMPPVVDPDMTVVERASVSFPDLVRMLGESIAAAQVSLDRASAALTAELAATRVEVVPRVTERVKENGDVEFESAPPQQVSLLELGILPTFYQFSEATVEVVMDVKIVENESETTERSFGLFADTQSVKAERKLNRDVSMTSKLRATLVPVPMPLRVEPTRTTTPAPRPKKKPS